MRTVTIANEELLPEIVKMLSKGNEVILKAKGNSMLPYIRGGRDSVVLRKKDIYTIGDIVLSEVTPQVFVLHRIIKIKNNLITLMGDGNLKGTETCSPKTIYGYAVSIIRNGKRIKCGCGRTWRILLPIRRYLLAIYRIL